MALAIITLVVSPHWKCCLVV